MKFSAKNLLIILILFVGFLTFTGAFFIVNETNGDFFIADMQMRQDRRGPCCYLCLSRQGSKQALISIKGLLVVDNGNHSSVNLRACRCRYLLAFWQCGYALVRLHNLHKLERYALLPDDEQRRPR